MGASELLLVRHGESVANTAARAAHEAGAQTVEVPTRDPDVALTATGEQQAKALGAWLGALDDGDAPQRVWTSPYLRATETARLALEVAGLDLPTVVDERLRDREMGILDRLTGAGVAARYPEEAQRRRWIGKFYYRPPGGESWADLALRVRSVLADVDRLEDGHRVLVVCHDAIVMTARSVCEGLAESDVMAISGSTPVRNASVTRLVRVDDRRWDVHTWNAVDHLEDRGTEPTDAPGRTDVGED